MIGVPQRPKMIMEMSFRLLYLIFGQLRTPDTGPGAASDHRHDPTESPNLLILRLEQRAPTESASRTSGRSAGALTGAP